MTLSTPRYVALALAGLFAATSCTGSGDSDTTAASDTTAGPPPRPAAGGSATTGVRSVELNG